MTENATSRAVAVVDPAIPPLLSLRAAADVLGCSRSYVRTRCARSGVEPIVLDTRHLAYVADDVQAIADGRTPARPDVPQILTPAGAAARLRVNFNHLDRALRAGDLPGREVRSSTGSAVAAVVRGEVVELVDQVAAGAEIEEVASVAAELVAGIQATADLIRRFR